MALRLGTFLKLESDGAVTMPLARLAGDEFAVAIRHLQSDSDVTKAIKLESEFRAAAGPAEHMLIDITPGSGKLEGRAVLTLHFGTLFLAGALS